MFKNHDRSPVDVGVPDQSAARRRLDHDVDPLAKAIEQAHQHFSRESIGSAAHEEGDPGLRNAKERYRVDLAKAPAREEQADRLDQLGLDHLLLWLGNSEIREDISGACPEPGFLCTIDHALLLRFAFCRSC
jgi:hypothetical protein